MSNTFEIIEVAENASGSYEAMGSKPKFWFFHVQHGALNQYLFKEARPNTGEDWSEKIASEICSLLGLPHAHYELAKFRGKRGSASLNFVVAPPEIQHVLQQASFWGEAFWGEAMLFNVPEPSLVHGNELLFELVRDYDRQPVRKYHVSQHRLDLVLRTVSDESINLPLGWTPPPGVTTAAETFVGYLLLDALIGNTDRHHENWGVVEWNRTSPERNVTRYLAPTYDHASSMGCLITDEDKFKRLETSDQGYSVEAFAQRARSALYLNAGDTKALSLMDAFIKASERLPVAARVWLDRLVGVSSLEVETLFARLPSELASESASRFARKLLDYNRSRLIDLRSTL
ncbi:MAG: hypothetical protein WKF30_17930 [Pyrinomonadaceae bacterium]